MKRARDGCLDPSSTDKGGKRARDGYLDPSSTDTNAADETDEVEVEVRCLTGEGVTLSVSRSMLGSHLRRLVSEKLPRKQGAKIVVHDMNAKLTLNKNLRARDCWKIRSAVLPCTYIPTSVYAA